MAVVREALADRGADAADTARDERDLLFHGCHLSVIGLSKKTPGLSLGFEPLSSDAIKEEEALGLKSLARLGRARRGDAGVGIARQVPGGLGERVERGGGGRELGLDGRYGDIAAGGGGLRGL